MEWCEWVEFVVAEIMRLLVVRILFPVRVPFAFL